MKLQTVEKKIKDGKDQLSHLESGTSLSPLALPHSKKVASPEKSKQGKVMAHSLKSNKDVLQNSIRKRKLSGDSFLFDVSLKLSWMNISLIPIILYLDGINQHKILLIL